MQEEGWRKTGCAWHDHQAIVVRILRGKRRTFRFDDGGRRRSTLLQQHADQPAGILHEWASWQENFCRGFLRTVQGTWSEDQTVGTKGEVSFEEAIVSTSNRLEFCSKIFVFPKGIPKPKETFIGSQVSFDTKVTRYVTGMRGNCLDVQLCVLSGHVCLFRGTLPLSQGPSEAWCVEVRCWEFPESVMELLLWDKPRPHRPGNTWETGGTFELPPRVLEGERGGFGRGEGFSQEDSDESGTAAEICFSARNFFRQQAPSVDGLLTCQIHARRN